jgi:hypothetical protein
MAAQFQTKALIGYIQAQMKQTEACAFRHIYNIYQGDSLYYLGVSINE